ncbi:putative bifunctional diguanylate cyclase/phosphodiesterase [Ensifer soli]|uniref:putative bifunctional diguanylate cyclase/phosphodiesterase n=1 Tax=Ciceribacter sp. sgz301302 TaxID=3342379 RepID=UPI0035BA44CB
MMLTPFLPRSEQRYALVGAVVGALLPALCLALGPALIGGDLATSFSKAASCLVIALPIVSACVFYRFGRARAGLIDALQMRDLLEAGLIREARRDQLTGLANRFALEQAVRDLAPTVAAGQARPALLLVDLDRFKVVNDTMGHDAGDALLDAFSGRLSGALAGAAALYRLGGDEFVLLVPGAPSEGKVEDVCRTVKVLLDRPFALPAGPYLASVSIGVTFFETEDASLASVLKRADLALYKAKETALCSHAFHTPDLTIAASARLALETDIARAIAQDEFFLEYQPIVGVESGTVRSFEALLRWRHPERGLIAPDAFIPTAERSGLILPLGNWVVRAACLEASRWPAPTGVAVNVSGDQFKDRSFVSFVRSCLVESGLSPARLTIEVTESIFTVDPEIVCLSLAELRGFGVRVALDDFGAGFSSISNLRRFPLDHLKIDRSFTQAMLASKRDAELVDIILKLGNTFQIPTTVEGVETESQLDFIRSLGAAQAQGYLISRPVPAGEVPALLARVNAPKALALSA